MTLRWPTKGPTEIEDYDLDWSQRLATGDTIQTSTWVILGTPTNLVISSSSFTTTRTKAFLSLGNVNQTYTLQNTVTTLAGDTLIETVAITIKAK